MKLSKKAMVGLTGMIALVALGSVAVPAAEAHDNWRWRAIRHEHWMERQAVANELAQQQYLYNNAVNPYVYAPAYGPGFVNHFIRGF